MINIFQPNINNNSLELLSKVFESNWLGRGKYVEEFENKLGLFLNIYDNLHTISSCTDAIFGVFDIFNLKHNSEVIMPSISFPAVGSAVLRSNLIPKIIDIDILSGNISIDSLKKAITKNTSAVFVTHYGGIPVEIDKIREVVGDKVYIFEDSA